MAAPVAQTQPTRSRGAAGLEKVGPVFKAQGWHRMTCRDAKTPPACRGPIPGLFPPPGAFAPGAFAPSAFARNAPSVLEPCINTKALWKFRFSGPFWRSSVA